MRLGEEKNCEAGVRESVDLEFIVTEEVDLTVRVRDEGD